MSTRIYFGETISTPFKMAPAPAPGTCTGCLLFAEAASSKECAQSGCQPRENPKGTGYRIVKSRIAPAGSVLATKEQVLADEGRIMLEATELLVRGSNERIYQPFWPDRAAARTADPVTSHAAAAKVKVGSLREAIVSALLGALSITPSWPGRTGKEIALAAARPLNSITPRFKGMVEAGIIRDSGEVRDGQTVWELV